MLTQIVTENGQKKIKPLTADVGAGNPVGTMIAMYKKSNPSGYLYLDGSTFDQAQYPLLYAYLGSNVLPDKDTGRQSTDPYYYIKATSGLSENQQDNVINQLNEQRSYSTEETLTGKTWIDGKPIYKQVVPMFRNGSLLSGFTSVGSGRYTSTVTPRNMERIINNYASVLRRNGVCDTIVSSAGNSYGFCTYTNGDVYLNINIGTITDIDIILEYTKTTD